LHSLAVRGTTIEYTDSGGDGEPVLLVPAGVFGAWFVPLVASPELEGLRVIRLVRAGYTCHAPTAHLTLADHAAHAAALLDHLGIPTAHVVGHSSGSVIAMQLGLDRPDLVGSLVLCEPPLIGPLADPRDLEFLHAAVGQMLGGAMAAANSGDVPTAFDSFMSVICGPDYREVLRAALGPDGVARAEQESRFFFADEIPAVEEWRFDAQVAAGLRAPVLLVQGGTSPPPVHRLVAHLAAMLPDAEIATIDGDNHLLPLRSPDALGRLIAQFAHAHSTATDQAPR
jgi:pimeloyl-ACP methyl ester carboxylesterase